MPTLMKSLNVTSDVLLEDSEKEDIAFLVVGDPFGYVARGYFDILGIIMIIYFSIVLIQNI